MRGCGPAPLVRALLLCWAPLASSYSVEVGEHGPLIRREVRLQPASLLAASGSGAAATSADNPGNDADGSSSDELVVDSEEHHVAKTRKKTPCGLLLAKARRLLEAYSRKFRYSRRQSHSVVQAVHIARELRPGGLSQENLTTLQASLGKVGLATALATGDVWTSEDQSGLWSGCLPQGDHQQLEEHSITGLLGERIVQGDIIIPAGAALAEAAYPGNALDHWLYNRSHSVVRWCFASSATEAAKAAFLEATKHIASQVPCLAFHQLQRSDRDDSSCAELPSVAVGSQPSGCWSHLGQVSGRPGPHQGRSQRLNLGPGCELLGSAAHQLMHALGIGHELSRIDRDEFVQILKENAQGGNLNFPLNSVPPPPEAYEGHSFDMLSLMMLNSRAFSTTGEVTLQPKGDAKLHRYLGQRMGLSQLDAERLAEHYGCGDDVRPSEPSRYLSKQLLLGEGVRPVCHDREYTNFFAGTKANPVACADLWGGCESGKDGGKVRQACPSTCMRCVPEPSDFHDEGVLGNGSAAKTANSSLPIDGADVLPAITVCADSIDTGFAFASGAGRTCAELVGFCDDKDVGFQVMSACPLTCGRCGLSGGGEGPFVGASSCADLPARAPPRFMKDGADGVMLECASLKDHCSKGEHSDFVSRKCPATCGLCQELAMENATDVVAAAEAVVEAARKKKKAATTTTKTTTSHLLQALQAEEDPADSTTSSNMSVDMQGTNQDDEADKADKQYNQTAPSRGAGDSWCSRRRRWGFCYSRRRRLD